MNGKSSVIGKQLIKFSINTSINLEKFIVSSYLFHQISEDIQTIQDLPFKNIKESEFMIINQCENQQTRNIYFIIGFKNLLIIVDQSNLSNIQNIFSENPNKIIYFMPKTKNIFNHEIKINNIQYEIDQNIHEEISNFNRCFYIKQTAGPPIQNISNSISSCITGYLIFQSHMKIKKSQKIDFSLNFNNSLFEKSKIIIKKYDENEFIELKILGSGSSSNVALMYEIKNGDLVVQKRFNTYESEKLMSREYENYLSLNYPLLPKMYGKVIEKNFQVYQFIDGQTLKNIEDFHFNKEDKIIIIFQIMMIVEYLHKQKFVYRDLKPDNIMIDENKTVFIIDFDRMLKITNIDENQDHTNEMQDTYSAPEVNLGKISYENDIYSIGQMIYYIINENKPKKEKQNNANIEYFYHNQKLLSLFKRCTEDELNKRPSISDLMFEFYIIFSSQINDSIIHNLPIIQYFKGIIDKNDEYIKQDINKALHYLTYAANQNYTNQQFTLGFIFYEGKYIKRDINQSIKYYTLAANQNHVQAQHNLGVIYYECKYIKLALKYFILAANQNHQEAQFNLGLIYESGKYVELDIKKAIYFYTHASNQNFKEAQYNLGKIYESGKYVNQDINKAIHYFTLAANQNSSKAQFNLGIIYESEKYMTQDINKAIHYYTLAANQNFREAQYNLGIIYLEGKYAKQDIKKAIHYFTLAANQNFPEAQYNLGVIYESGQYVKRDIQKAIHYFTLSSNQNNALAQLKLGTIYYLSKYSRQDINKAIRYFELAAKQNNSDAQLLLGVIFFDRKYIERDIKKSIYFLSLAANQNNSIAQFNLGSFYYNGNYIKQDINIAIYFFSLAAKQNHKKALINLGVIFYEGKYIKRDVKKAIEYFTIAAKQNVLEAQFNLAIIYYLGLYIQRDIDRSIYYFKLAADQNCSQAQYNLGVIYYDNEYIKRDIQKSIHYFTLAVNQDHTLALYFLGVLYYDDKYIQRDLKKSFQYFSQAAIKHCAGAQLFLGYMYYKGEFVQRDINKCIYYYTLSANQNCQQAQFLLGVIYIFLNFVEKKPNKGIDFLIRSASNGNVNANFAVGFFYHEGKYVNKDIQKAIHYYKEASSLNNQYAKNNLGIIYKYGDGEKIQRNIALAIEYFENVIKQKNDKISMYNLAHIFIYEIQGNERIDSSIELLIKSSKQQFLPSNILLTIALIKKHGFNFENIKKDLFDKTECNDEFTNKICQKIMNLGLLNQDKEFENLYEKFKSIDYLYDFPFRFMQSKLLYSVKSTQKKDQDKYNITSSFYQGFSDID